MATAPCEPTEESKETYGSHMNILCERIAHLTEEFGKLTRANLDADRARSKAAPLLREAEKLREEAKRIFATTDVNGKTRLGACLARFKEAVDAATESL